MDAKFEQALSDLRKVAKLLQSVAEGIRGRDLNDDYRSLCRIQADVYRLDYALEQRRQRKGAK
jgi:hypothetical protein